MRATVYYIRTGPKRPHRDTVLYRAQEQKANPPTVTVQEGDYHLWWNHHLSTRGFRDQYTRLTSK
jgi:hypothetical protein